MDKFNGTDVIDISDMERGALVDRLSDDELQTLASSFAVSWSSPTRVDDARITDEDGFPLVNIDNMAGFSTMQKMCWEKFNENPQINSHVRDVMGALTGWGFSVCSDVEEIEEVITEISEDFRNELYKKMPKFAARSEIEGELFLALSLHEDGFTEVDFMEPSALTGNGDKASGIYFHPRKGTMPIFYEFVLKMADGSSKNVLIPSIYVAYEPKLADETILANKIDTKLFAYIKSPSSKYKKIGGYKTFITSWDKGFLTKRNISHIKTTIKWLNHYTQLKEWEIDHKKSSGSYLWVAEMTDMKAFRTWLKMSDEERAATGLTSKKTPGGTIILPFGMKLSCVNPQLASITEQDTDIMHMVTSGLNKPEDMVTGQTKGDTFSGIKASRGPQADRMKDELAYWERFLRFDFWKAVFFLRSVMNTEFKLEYKIKKTVAFKNKKPVTKTVTKKAHELLEFSFPQSEIVDVEAKARAFLGVNHQSVCETLGIPKGIVAEKLGLTGYKNLRYAFQDEEDTLPELPLTAEIASSAAETGQAFKTGNSNQGNTPVKADPNAQPAKSNKLVKRPVPQEK
jgi:hypothetical protein